MGNFISGLFGGRRPKDDGLGYYKGWLDSRSRDLTVATDEETGTGQHILDRRTKDWSRNATLEAVKRPQWQKSEPYYKEAYQKSKQNDTRLEEIGIEVRLQEERLAEVRKSDKAAKEVIWSFL
jgi:sentrin-specific protease 1